MENEEDIRQSEEFQSGSQVKPVSPFGSSQSNKEKESIKNRINETKSRNLNNNREVDTEVNTRSSSLGEKPGLGESPSSGLESVSKNEKAKEAKKDTDGVQKAGGSSKSKISNIVTNTALGAASNKSEAVRKTASAVNTAKTGIKAVKVVGALFANPFALPVLAFVGIFALILFIIIILAMVVNSLGMKYGLSGEETINIFNEEYAENMSREELDKLMANSEESLCEEGFFDSIRHFFGSWDLTDSCELSQYVKKIIEDKQKSVAINPISPGYIMSSLYYSFDTQNYDENGELFINPADYIESENVENLELINDLDAISTLMAVKLYNKDTLETLLDRYIFHDSYSYYRLEFVVPTGGTEEDGEWVCVSHYEDDYHIDENKLKLYLRYGDSVVNAYVEDMNNLSAYKKTSSSCLESLPFSKPDVSKYETKADPSTNDDDNAKITVGSGTYGYDSGFIFTTYPRYKAEYTVGGAITYDYKIDKEIEQFINNIESRQDYTNYLLGYPSTIKTDIINSESICVYNIGGVDISNVQVRLLHGYTEEEGVSRFDEIEGESLVDFDKYVLGVVYAEVGGFDDEVSKTQAIAARSYALARAKTMSGLSLEEENGSWILSIRNSTEDQVYCNPDEGCYQCEGYNTIFTKNGIPDGATCELWKEPLASDSRIRSAVREVSGMVLTDSNSNPLHASYTATTQNGWQTDALSGLDYVEILRKTYGSEYTITKSTCTYGATGEWAKWRQYSSPWGNKYLGSQTMSKVGCFITAYSMILAKSAPKLTTSDFNPGTFLSIIKQNRCLSGNNLYSDCALRAAVGEGVTITNVGVSLYNKTYNEKVGIISQYLNQGYDVMLRVKSPESARIYNESSDQHWVVVTGINGSDILMADPASDATVVLDKYHEEGIVYFQYVKFE